MTYKNAKCKRHYEVCEAASGNLVRCVLDYFPSAALTASLLCCLGWSFVSFLNFDLKF